MKHRVSELSLRPHIREMRRLVMRLGLRGVNVAINGTENLKETYETDLYYALREFPVSDLKVEWCRSHIKECEQVIEDLDFIRSEMIEGASYNISE